MNNVHETILDHLVEQLTAAGFTTTINKFDDPLEPGGIQVAKAGSHLNLSLRDGRIEIGGIWTDITHAVKQADNTKTTFTGFAVAWGDSTTIPIDDPALFTKVLTFVQEQFAIEHKHRMADFLVTIKDKGFDLNSIKKLQ